MSHNPSVLVYFTPSRVDFWLTPLRWLSYQLDGAYERYHPITWKQMKQFIIHRALPSWKSDSNPKLTTENWSLWPLGVRDYVHRHWKRSKVHCVLKALKHASLIRVSQTSSCANIEVINQCSFAVLNAYKLNCCPETWGNAAAASVVPSNCRGFVQVDLGETTELGINNLSQNVTRMQIHIQAIQSGPMVRAYRVYMMIFSYLW